MPPKSSGSKSTIQRRGIRKGSGGIADWANASPDILIRAICSAAITGGALRFGYSRDGGAYALGIYGDGEPYTEFIKPGEDLDELLTNVESVFQEIHDSLMANRTAK